MIAVILLVVLAIVLVIVRAQSDKKQNKEAKDQPQKATGETWMGAFEAYDVAFNAIKKNPKFTVITAAVMMVGYAFSVLIQGQPQVGKIHWPLEYVLLMPLFLVMPAYSLAVTDGKKPSFASLYRRPLRAYGSLIVAGLLAEIIILLSMLLFIIPFIWTAAWFTFAALVVMDKNMGPIKALKESKRLAQGNIGKVWGIIGVSFLLGFAVSLISAAPIIGDYISVAVTVVCTVWAAVATAGLYRWLQKNVKV